MRNVMLFTLVLGMVVLSLMLAPPATIEIHTLERVEGPARTVERFDADGRPHGLQEYYIDGKPSQTINYFHGQVTEHIIYEPDGAVREHWKESDNYEFIRVK